MTFVRILHNPRCSKSRQTLALLEDNGVQAEIISYLTDPLSVEQLAVIAQQLKLDVRQMIRTSEDAYKDLGLKDKSLTDAQLLKAMADYPKLIQRPIVINDNKAAIGRPPENILSIL